MDPDGGNIANISGDEFILDRKPAWSPDGSKIVYESNHGDSDSGYREIYLMNADGSNKVNLSNAPDQEDLNPAWSHDATRVIFFSDRSGAGDIWSMSADGNGSDAQKLIDTGGQEEDNYPSWSPLGGLITFASGGFNNKEIYTSTETGSQKTQLTNNNADDLEPALSPNGNKIAFISNRDGNYGVYVMNADGSQQTKLADNARSFPARTFPTWSPGRHKDRLLWQRSRYPCNECRRHRPD